MRAAIHGGATGREQRAQERALTRAEASTILPGMRFRLKRRVKKMNVCTRCEATMERRTSIPEAAGRRYWGDVEPYVYVGDAEIHHFICTSCGNLTAIQFREAA